jgi:predicted nucleic acid-binding protein
LEAGGFVRLSDVALDTNVLAYFTGVIGSEADRPKVSLVSNLLDRLDAAERIAIPSQVLGECFNVLCRSGRGREEAMNTVTRFAGRYPVVGGGYSTMTEALSLAVQHNLQIWDALILASASEAGCSILLSEDMQDGFCWRGVTIINPFGDRAETALFG